MLGLARFCKNEARSALDYTYHGCLGIPLFGIVMPVRYFLTVQVIDVLRRSPCHDGDSLVSRWYVPAKSTRPANK